MAGAGSMFVKGRWPRRSLIAAAGLILLLVAALLIVRGIAASAFGRDFVERRVEAAMPSGQRVEIEKLSGDLLGRFHIKSLSVSDAEGRWLNVRNIDFAWSPARLFRRHLDIREVEISTVEVFRRPVLEELPDEPAEEASGQGPLRRYSLAGFSVDELIIGEALIGRAERFELSAELDTTLVAGQGRLDLVPANASGDRIDAALRWEAGEPVNASISAAGPDGGLLHEVLGLTAEGAVLAELHASGSRGEWKAEATLLVGEAEYANGEANAGERGGSVEARVDLSVLGALASVAERLGGPVTVNGSYNDAAERAEIKLMAPRLSVDVGTLFKAGTFAFEDNPISLKIESADPHALLGREEVSASSFTVSGQIIKEDENWQFEGESRIEGPALVNLSPEGDIRARDLSGPLHIAYAPAAREFTTVADIGIDQLTGLGPVPAELIGRSPRLSLDLSVDLEGKTLNLTQLSVSGSNAEMTAIGAVPFGLKEMSLSGSGSVTSDLLDVRVPAFEWAVRSDTGERFDLTLDSTFGILHPPEGYEIWLGTPFQLNMQARYRRNGDVSVSSLTARNDGMDLQGVVSVQNDVIDGELQLTLAGGQSGVIGFDQMVLETRISGARAQPGFTSNLSALGLMVGGEAFEDASLGVTGSVSGGAVSANIQTAGLWRGEQASFAANVFASGQSWRLDDLELAVSELLVEGGFSGEGGALSSVRGVLNMDGRVTALEVAPYLSGHVELADETVDVEIALRELISGETKIDDITLVGDGTRDMFSGKVTASGEFGAAGRSRSFTLTSPLQIDLIERAVQISPQGSFAGQEISTLVPISVSGESGGERISGALGLLGGRADFKGGRTETGFSGSLDAAGIAIEQIANLIEAPALEGRSDLSFEISAADNGLTGKGQFAVSGLKRLHVDAPGLDLILDGTLSGAHATVTGRVVDAADTLVLDLNAAAPVLSSREPLGVALPPDAAVSITVSGGGAVAPIWALLGPPETRFEGIFNLDAAISGPVDGLVPYGQFTLSEGVLEEGVLGLRLRELGFVVGLDGDGVEVSALTAAGSKGGTLSGGGRYGFDGDAAVTVTLDRLQALQRSDASAILSGTLALTGAESGSRIDGDLTLDRAEIDIERLPAAGYKTLDVSFQDADGDMDAEAEPILPVRLDIALQADDRVFINGNGLKTEWALDTRITGTATAPELDGTARVVRGSIDLIGRNFQFAESSVQFTGDPANPQLAIGASRSSGNLAAGFRVTGTAESPDFSLTSTPTLPDDEILSRVLFGRSPTELSGFEAAQLAAAIASLAGGGGFDLIGPVQDVLGVDRLDFGVSSSGAPTIGAGKYIANDVYVELRSSTRGAPGVSVEWTPRNDIELGTDIDPEQSPRFTVQWKRDFDFKKSGKATDGVDAEPDQ